MYNNIIGRANIGFGTVKRKSQLRLTVSGALLEYLFENCSAKVTRHPYRRVFNNIDRQFAEEQFRTTPARRNATRK